MKVLNFIKPKRGPHYTQMKQKLAGGNYDRLRQMQFLDEAKAKDIIELKEANLKKAQEKEANKMNVKIKKALIELSNPQSKLSKFFSQKLGVTQTGDTITPLSILNHCEYKSIKTSYPPISKLIEELQVDLKDSNPKETAKQYQKAIQFMLKNKILNFKNNGKAVEAHEWDHGVSYPIERRDDCWSGWKNLIHYKITRTELGTKILQQQAAKQTI